MEGSSGSIQHPVSFCRGNIPLPRSLWILHTHVINELNAYTMGGGKQYRLSNGRRNIRTSVV